MTTQEGALVWNVDVEAQPQRLWDGFFDAGTPLPFYFGSVLEWEPKPGAAIRYLSADGRRALVEGEVIGIVPGHWVTHTFRFPDLAEPPQQVTTRVTALDKGARLTVTHAVSDIAPDHLRRITRGWPAILRDLKAHVETGRVGARARCRNWLLRHVLRIT